MQNLFELNPILSVGEKSPHYEFSTRLVDLWTSFAKNGYFAIFTNKLLKFSPLILSIKSSMCKCVSFASHLTQRVHWLRWLCVAYYLFTENAQKEKVYLFCKLSICRS